MIKLNGVELELDIMDLETSEKIESEMEKVVKESNRAKGMKRTESIRIQCMAVFNCFDNIFGEGIHKKIFGSKVNLRDCLRVFAEFTEELRKLDNKDERELKEIAEKYAPNRTQRRNNNKSNNRRNYNKNKRK